MSPLAREKACQAKALLDGSAGLIPKIQWLSGEVHLNRVCLQKAFQELYGMSIGSYGRILKMNQIKKLLGNYLLTLDAIAEETGFNGSAALIRFFKQTEGMSPGAWRRKNAEI